MFDAYLKIEGVPGECKAKGYEDQIEIMSFNHGVSQPASAAASTAGGGTTQRCDHQDFSVVKALDKATPVLCQKCSSGEHIPMVTLVLTRAAGEDKVVYMKYTLNNCIVSSVSIGGGSGEPFPVESVTFNYGKIVWEYTAQKRKDGKGGGTVPGSWNLETNSKE